MTDPLENFALPKDLSTDYGKWVWPRLAQLYTRTLVRLAREHVRGKRRSKVDVLNVYSASTVASTLDALRSDAVGLIRFNGRVVMGSFRQAVLERSRVFAQYIQHCRPRRVLDVGANCGITTARLAEFAPGPRYVAVDQSVPCCQGAVQHIRDSGHDGVGVVAGDGIHLPFRDASFDFVFTNSVLYTMDDYLDEVLAELSRVGCRWFLFVEPFYESMSRFQRWYHWRKGFLRPVFPRLRAHGFRIVDYKVLPSTANPLVTYWMAFGEIERVHAADRAPAPVLAGVPALQRSAG